MGSIGMMENKMEATIGYVKVWVMAFKFQLYVSGQGLGFRACDFSLKCPRRLVHGKLEMHHI